MALSVLIVDDDAPFRALARELLEADGLVVTGEAADGESALRQVAALDPDVVLLDVYLHGANGCDLAAELTAGGARAAVVLVSSRPEASFGRRIAECGARGFIPKERLSAAALTELVK